jgi:hypothetical protein
MIIRRTVSPTLFSFGFTSSSQPTSRTSTKVSRLIVDLADTMSHKVEVLLYLNVAWTIRTSIELLDMCETEADGFTVSTPYALRMEWRTLIAHRVIEDIIYDHRALDSLTDVLLVQDKFRILRHNGTSDQDNCNRQSAFKQRLTTSVAANKTFCVAIHLHDAVMESLRLFPPASSHRQPLLQFQHQQHRSRSQPQTNSISTKHWTSSFSV